MRFAVLNRIRRFVESRGKRADERRQKLQTATVAMLLSEGHIDATEADRLKALDFSSFIEAMLELMEHLPEIIEFITLIISLF